MIKRLYRQSRSLLAQYREALAAPKRVVQTLASEEQFFAALPTDCSASLLKAGATYRAGNRQHALEQLAEHYRTRTEPSFFISSAEIEAAVERLHSSRPDWVAQAMKHADRMASGTIGVYASQSRLSNPEEWARAPAGPGNDLLYRYRPHRFGFVPRLALASLYGHSDALAALEKLIGDWALSIQPDAEFARGFREFRTSSHVAVYRSVALTWTLAFLRTGEKLSCELEVLLLRIIYGDALYIHQCLPMTGRNNHLLADGFGLWFIGSLYPEFNEAHLWKSEGTAVFHRELLWQTYADGTSFEHSVHYHEHACEMAAAYLLLCRRNGWVVSDDLSARIQSMLYFQSRLSGVHGTACAIGDTTEDPLFPLDADDAWCTPTLRALHGHLFDASNTRTKSTLPSLERAFWLTGGKLPDDPLEPAECEPRLTVFAEGGFAILTARQGNDTLVFRTGPKPGTHLAPGHMHFDFLSVSLSIDGDPILIPGGTYSYRSTPRGWTHNHGKWRPYFLSARASNGLILSDRDPLGRPAGDFPGGIRGDIACRVHTAQGKSSDSLAWISARTDTEGEYAGWSRSILQVKDDYWLILDELPDRSDCPARCLGFQFAAGTRIGIENQRSISAHTNRSHVRIEFSSGIGTPQILTGSTQPVAGWVSNRYGELLAAPQLLMPIASMNPVVACVICRATESSMHNARVLCDSTAAGFDITVTMGDFLDRFELGFASEHDRRTVHWSRTIDNITVNSETA